MSNGCPKCSWFGPDEIYRYCEECAKKRVVRDSQCSCCGEYFHKLGLASHRARCWERKKKAAAIRRGDG